MTLGLDPPRDPRSVLRAHRAVDATDNPAVERVEKLLAVQGDWLRTRVRWAARRFRLDADELCQELMLGMLRRSTTVDETNAGVRTWLGVRVDRTAIELTRRHGRESSESPERLGELERDEANRGRWPADPHTEITLDVNHLKRLGLTHHEAQVVALRCTGVDMTLKEFAELVHRTHASVRQEFVRGIRKIENLFGLTAEEAQVIRAWQRHGTARDVGRSIGRTDEDVVRILEGAQKKIDRVFDEKEGQH